MTTPTPTTCPECGKELPGDTSLQLCPACLMAQAMASRTLAGEPVPNLPPPPPPEEIAAHFPQFEILGCLGRGGMGVVYQARQKSLNRLVAIKILAPEKKRDGKFAERFAREAELLAKLSHPHIVTIHDFGEAGGLYYLVMEFIDGVNLRDLLREGKLLPEQALAIIPPVCDALQFAHDRGIVHRDIKPENLLLDRAGRVKIADFGIAALAGDPAARTGTPAYMAPEQNGKTTPVDHRADIYALGVVLYEMLTGERPATSPVAPSKRVQIDVRLDEVVLRALEHKPELRFQQASDFSTRVGTILDSLESSAKPGPAVSKAESTRQSALAMLAHFAPAVLLIVAWFTSGLERGAVMVLSVVVVAVLVIRAISAGKPRKPLWIGLAVFASLGVALLVTWDRSAPDVNLVVSPVPTDPSARVTVENLGSFPTLTEALAKAPDNAVIRLAAGIFAERIAIDRPVTLIGAGWERTRIEAQGPVYQDDDAFVPPPETMVPTVRIRSKGRVTLDGIAFTLKGRPREGGPAAVNVIDAGSAATLRNCAILGSPGSGVGAKDATLAMSGCLIAAAWGTGIEIEGGSDAEIHDCEVRNCYHRCITISPASGKVSISGCRISGSAWHGIRYDDCSPKIIGNLIFGNARSGIYVSGETAGEISGNLLVRNDMDGISCWEKSRDRIERNTFADNSRDSIILCGMASPKILGNIFLGAGISQPKGNPEQFPDYKVGTPVVEHNLFWGGAGPWQSGAADKDQVQPPGSRENFVEDPRFGDGYVLPADSTLPGRQIGPEKVLSIESPYPLQPEEQAVIPGAPRDWQGWKR